jgi:thioesterase domain-containing protein/acyl carrier protein
MDDAGNFLNAGQSGEIVIRGANVTLGYENNPTANQSAFTDGWFRTGDEGVMDAHGYLSITGRLKEMVNRGGEKVVPREVDEALLDHPDVVQAVAFAVPHPTLGEDLAAAVIVRDQSPVTEKELREFAFARLADYKVPSQVVLVDEIPKGPTGKLQRIGLAEKLAAKLNADFVPPRNSLEAALAKSWAELLGLDRVGIYDNFFALGGDSLTATAVLLDIEKLVGKELHPAVLFQAPTIEQLADRLQNGAEAAEPALLLPIQSGDTRTPLFCVPGHDGDVFTFVDLARNLGAEQPVYSFRFPEKTKQNPNHIIGMIEELATSFIQEMQSFQPEGPYLLCGDCFGGQVAFEMAQQLHAQGKTVGLVAIIDAYLAGTIHMSGLSQRARYHLNSLVQRDSKEKITYLADLAKNRLIRTSRRFFPTVGRRLFRALDEDVFIPQTYPGRITLFRPTGGPTDLHRDPQMGWGGLATEIKVYDIPADRSEVFKEPYVQVLAKQLSDCLREERITVRSTI